MGLFHIHIYLGVMLDFCFCYSYHLSGFLVVVIEKPSGLIELQEVNEVVEDCLACYFYSISYSIVDVSCDC